jgi:phosphoribosylaminoimidazolecarboxamide formyltransferase/IMP cyclohydrolase
LAAQSNYTPADYRHYDRVPIRRALISVSNKTGLLELAKALDTAGVELVSTGSTAKTIADAGIKVTEVSEVTGFAEALDGRVKTLHPAIHGGLLADMRLIAHEDQLAGLGYQPFQLAVVNLYPFVETVQSGATPDQVIEQIDIGGPAMVRAAAKNHANVAIVVEPNRYDEIIAALDAGGTTLAQRRELALAAFSHTAKYDAAVASWFAEEQEAQWRSLAGQTTDESSKNPGFAADIKVSGELATVLRYGENAHQAAALYRTKGDAGIA